MMRALYTAASGMMAQERNLDNIANNLANSSTSGFRSRRLQFEDLIYQNLIMPGAAATQQTTEVAGLQVGLGTRSAASEVINLQGDFTQTGNPLDLTIQGAGFFQALAQTQQEINTDELEISSGRSVNVPSDNPAAAAVLIQNADQTSQADQFQRSLGSVQGEIQNADSALNSVTTALQRAISLGVEGANGTLNSADRAALATEVEGIQTQLISLANLTYQGNYVFAGTATQTTPYVLDPSSPSGVTYAGNAGVNHVTLGNHFSLRTNLPGSQLFSAAGSDMFQSIQDLITSLQSGTGVSAAVSAVDSASSQIDTQRVFYDNALNQLNAQQTFLTGETTQLAQQQNTVGGADLPAVITNLTTAQTSLQATLEAVGQSSRLSLFDFLK